MHSPSSISLVKDNMVFKNRQLIFSDVPYDDIILFLNSLNIPVPIDITETYVLALSELNKNPNNILQDSIKNWIYAYELQEKEYTDPQYYNKVKTFLKSVSNDRNNKYNPDAIKILSYLHVFGNISYNIELLNQDSKYKLLIFRLMLGLEDIEIPDELLLTSLLNENDNRNIILDNYGEPTNKSLAHIGDRVAEIIITNMVVKYNINQPCDPTSVLGKPEGASDRLPDLNSKIRLLVTNKSFRCYIDRKRLCNYISGGNDPNSKLCADIFESIIGAIYYWYYLVLNNPNTLNIIESWLIKTFKFNIIVEKWLYNNIAPCDSIKTLNLLPTIPFNQFSAYEPYLGAKIISYDDINTINYNNRAIDPKYQIWAKKDHTILTLYTNNDIYLTEIRIINNKIYKPLNVPPRTKSQHSTGTAQSMLQSSMLQSSILQSQRITTEQRLQKSSVSYEIIVLVEFLFLKQMNIPLNNSLYELLILSTSNETNIGCITKPLLYSYGVKILKLININLILKTLINTQPIIYAYPKTKAGFMSIISDKLISNDNITCYMTRYEKILSYIGNNSNFITIIGSIYYWSNSIDVVTSFLINNLYYDSIVNDLVMNINEPCDSIQKLGTISIPFVNLISYSHILRANIIGYNSKILSDIFQISFAAIQYPDEYQIWANYDTKILLITGETAEYLTEVGINSDLNTLYPPPDVYDSVLYVPNNILKL